MDGWMVDGINGQTQKFHSLAYLERFVFEEATTHAVFFRVYPDTGKLPKIMQPSWKQGQAADWWKICDDIEWLLFEYHHPFEYIPIEPFDAVLPFHSIGPDQKTWRKERKSCKRKAITNVPTALETWTLSQAEGRWNNCMEWFGTKWTFCVSIFPNLIGSFDRSFVRSFTKQSTKIVIFYAPWQFRSLQLLMELHICVAQREKKSMQMLLFSHNKGTW